MDITSDSHRAAAEEELHEVAALMSLERRARTLADADPQEQRQLLAAVRKHLAAKVPEGLVRKDVFLASSTASALEQSGNYELASEGYRSFTQMIVESGDEKLSNLAKRWEGIARRLVLVGKEIQLEGTLADGTPFDWDAYRGKAVLVQFWNTECSPAVLGRVAANYELYHDRGLDVVVISLDHDRQILEQYLQREQPPWVTLHDKDAEGEHPMATYYGIARVPTAILVDQGGRVVSLQVGSQELDRPLEELLGPPYAPQGELTYIDLQPKANKPLADGTPNFPENNLEELPQGEHTFAGVKFRVGDSLIQLAGTQRPEMPEKVEEIVVAGKFTRLYLLHGTQYTAADGTLIGQYQVNYEDETTEMVPIVYGEDVRDWWTSGQTKSVANAVVGWEGANAATRQRNQTLRLYLTMWENPHPDKKVVSIDFISANTDAAPFCVAITVEAATGPSSVEEALDSPPE